MLVACAQIHEGWAVLGEGRRRRVRRETRRRGVVPRHRASLASDAGGCGGGGAVRLRDLLLGTVRACLLRALTCCSVPLAWAVGHHHVEDSAVSVYSSRGRSSRTRSTAGLHSPSSPGLNALMGGRLRMRFLLGREPVQSGADQWQLQSTWSTFPGTAYTDRRHTTSRCLAPDRTGHGLTHANEARSSSHVSPHAHLAPCRLAKNSRHSWFDSSQRPNISNPRLDVRTISRASMKVKHKNLFYSKTRSNARNDAQTS
jgi:hypothetical protein